MDLASWSIKDSLYGFRGNFSCGRQFLVPSGQDNVIFPTRVANYNAVFGLSFLQTKLAIFRTDATVFQSYVKSLASGFSQPNFLFCVMFCRHTMSEGSRSSGRTPGRGSAYISRLYLVQTPRSTCSVR